MKILIGLTAALPLVLASAAFAQTVPPADFGQARTDNVYDGTSHQPTPGVRTEEQQAGVALPTAKVQAENRSLSQINTELLAKARRDASANPLSTHNVYGVQPGGVVQSTPNAGGAGGAGGAAGASAGR